MKKLILYLNTIRFLKWQQIYFRLIKNLKKPKATECYRGIEPKRSKKWQHITLYDEKINQKLEFCFLNYTRNLKFPDDWNNESPSKLWVYNLHYFEDLLSNNAKDKQALHTQLLNKWVDQNPVGYGNGWEPYPTSLRIVNILKAWLGGFQLDEKLLSSTFLQASFLSSDLEKQLLGNHYFTNLKALLFAGVIFQNKRWLKIAEKGLVYEIPEQILEDGANFELSPMYHSLMLVDMLDMYNLSKAYPARVSPILKSLLESYIPKMLLFMEIMAHTDGGLSFFNDSSDGIAPKKLKIEKYAETLGFKINHIDLSSDHVIDSASSGYICAISKGDKLIFDTAKVGPNYIPGHAHADTLSFELSIGNQRVLVNSGTSEYGNGRKRLTQRKTSSHNTVEIDGQDSTQVWSSFRVANRAEIISKHVRRDDKKIELYGAHNGYKTLFGGCVHERKLTLSTNSLVISDTIKGKYKYAKSYFYFHPDLKVSIKQGLLKIDGAKLSMTCNLSNKVFSLLDSFWYPQFGIEVPNKMLEFQFENKQLDIEFKWHKG